jgi:hypothetical protein
MLCVSLADIFQWNSKSKMFSVWQSEQENCKEGNVEADGVICIIYPLHSNMDSSA